MGNAIRETEIEFRCRAIQSQAERRDRGQTEKSWLLFEGIDTFLYDLTRKTKIGLSAKAVTAATSRGRSFRVSFHVSSPRR